MATYSIEPERRTLHGTFSRELPPVLAVDPGDTVRFRTLDAGWHLEPRRTTTPDDHARKFEPRDAERDKGHALCGPVAIRGARPGMTLGVQINALRPGTWGWTVAGGWSSPVNERLGVTATEELLRWTLDPDAGTGRDQYGHVLPLHPFMGVMGLPPDLPGSHPTGPPRFCGGNIDCKELVAGSTLYLPITVDGALFSTGDGHGRQADGEICGTAIECPMAVVDLTFTLHEAAITTARARTPAGWLTFGFDEDLDEATLIATDAMLTLLGEQYGLPRCHALALASLVVDLRVTQMVNGVRGVHAVLPPGALAGGAPVAV